MRRPFRSVVQVRAKERTAALVALYTLFAPNPLLATMEAFRMMEAPSGKSGSAFCTVNRRPFTLTPKIESYNSSVIVPRGGVLRDAGVGEDDVQPSLLALDLGEQAIQVVQVRHVAPDGGDVLADLLHRRQFGLTPAGDEDGGAFGHEPLRRRQADAAAAARHESGFSFELTHISAL